MTVNISHFSLQVEIKEGDVLTFGPLNQMAKTTIIARVCNINVPSEF
jgi:hypothetical protein